MGCMCAKEASPLERFSSSIKLQPWDPCGAEKMPADDERKNIWSRAKRGDRPDGHGYTMICVASSLAHLKTPQRSQNYKWQSVLHHLMYWLQAKEEGVCDHEDKYIHVDVVKNIRAECDVVYHLYRKTTKIFVHSTWAHFETSKDKYHVLHIAAPQLIENDPEQQCCTSLSKDLSAAVELLGLGANEGAELLAKLTAAKVDAKSLSMGAADDAASFLSKSLHLAPGLAWKLVQECRGLANEAEEQVQAEEGVGKKLEQDAVGNRTNLSKTETYVAQAVETNPCLQLDSNAVVAVNVAEETQGDSGIPQNRDAAVYKMARCYAKALTVVQQVQEWQKYRNRKLRIMPLVEEAAAGKFASELPTITLEALHKSFLQLPLEVRDKLPKTLELCVGDKDAFTQYKYAMEGVRNSMVHA